MSSNRAQHPIKSIEIENFRGLKNLKIKETSLVNVIVGRNGTGKTTILEAIHLACSGNQPMEFNNLIAARGLFAYGGTLSAESYFCNFDVTKIAKCRLYLNSSDQVQAQSIAMQWEKSTALPPVYAQLDEGGNIVSASAVTERKNLGALQLTYQHPWHGSSEPKTHVTEIVFTGNGMQTRNHAGCTHCIFSKFLPLRTQNSNDPARLYSQMSRAGDKDSFDQWLKLVDPRIETLGVTAETQPASLEAKLKDQEKSIPVALLGDGLQRAMLFATHFLTEGVRVLCIDEIDVGLHRDTLKDLWKAIYTYCRDKNIQLFCTTHDENIISSLIEAIRDVGGDLDHFSVHLMTRKSNGEMLVQTRNAGYVDELQQANVDIMS
jgi:Fe-S cluster assembly ATPase SufC